MEYHVEGGHADVQLFRRLLAGSLFENPQADCQGVARVDASEGDLHPLPGDGEVVALDGVRITLFGAEIESIVVTNTVSVPAEKHFDKLTVLTIAPLLAAAIERIHSGASVGALFE